MPIVAPTIPDDVPRLVSLREASADLISAAIGEGPIVHKTWKLRADLQKSISLFKTSEDKVHGWMVGTGAIPTIKGANGGYEYHGGRKVNRLVKIIMWGFLDYTLYDDEKEQDSLTMIENECERIGDYFAANPKLGLDNANFIREIQPFDVENLDVHSVSEGFDVHIAQCAVNAILSRY